MAISMQTFISLHQHMNSGPQFEKKVTTAQVQRRGAQSINSVHRDNGLDHSAALELASAHAIDHAGARSHVRIHGPDGCRVLQFKYNAVFGSASTARQVREGRALLLM